MAELSFRCGAARIDLSAGVVTAVVHDAVPEDSFLTAAGELRAAVQGSRVVWGSPHLSVDADEVEVTWSSDSLLLVVRHTFTVGWGVRVALANLGNDEIRLDEAVLSWEVPAGWPAWALAAGAEGSFAVLRPRGAGPLLGGVLRLGSMAGVSAEGLDFGPVAVAPHGRYVVQWQWDFYSGPRDFDRGRHPDVPRRLDLLVGEAVTVASNEDVALVTSPGLHVETGRGQVELRPFEAGTHDVELRSARGLTSYTIRAADALERVLKRTATAVLGRPRTASGVVRLPDVDAALAVQRALAYSLLDDLVVEAEEALDLYDVRLPDDKPADARMVAYLCGEHSRTADPEPLHQAGRALLATRQPVPGLGMAATELCLARLLTGELIAPVLDHLVRLTGEVELPAAATPRTAQASLLELEVVTMDRAWTEGRARADSTVTERVLALGGWLGAGLKGRAVTPLPVDELAHLAAVLALLPEPVSAELRQRWGCTAHELARRGRNEVLCRFGAEAAGPALSWLVLGARPG